MKRWIACFLVLVLAVTLPACSQKQEQIVPAQTEPEIVPTEPVKKVIHVLIPEAGEGWQAMAAASASEAAEAVKAAGVHDVVVTTYADAAAQTAILEDLAAQSPGDGSVGVACMPAAEDMDAVFAKLLEANVSYALADTIPADAEAASVTNVCCDQRAIGAAAAAWLVQNGLTQENKVLIIQGLSEEEALRTEGFRQYLQGKLAYEDAVIEAPWTSTENIVYSDMQGETAESAKTYFSTYMQESDHADVKFIAAWEDAYVQGILEALEGEDIPQENKTRFLEGAPFLTGCGGSREVLDMLAGTSQYTAVSSFGDIRTAVYSADLLKIAVESMAAYFDGAVVPQDNTQPVIWATAEKESQEASVE